MYDMAALGLGLKIKRLIHMEEGQVDIPPWKNTHIA